VINLKTVSGTKLTVMEQVVARTESLIRKVAKPKDLGIIIDNIGVGNGFSAMYISNAAMHKWLHPVGLTLDRQVGSYAYIRRIKKRLGEEMPELTDYLSTGSLVNSAVNMGAPAPTDSQISGGSLEDGNRVAQQIASKLRQLSTVADVFSAMPPRSHQQVYCT
jgi:multidrug efflux pump subunit AcrB